MIVNSHLCSKNSVFHERTKLIELDCQFVREQLLVGLISLNCVHNKGQLANVMKSHSQTQLIMISLVNWDLEELPIEGECWRCIVSFGI